MEAHVTESIVAKRQLMRGVAEMLAGALEGEARVEFLARQEERINRTVPAPSAASMRTYLKANVVR
jgi:hypothetical protein